MFFPEVFYSRTPWMLYTECDILFSSTIVQSFTLTSDVIHTAQGLWYPGVQDPEQGRPGARWTVPPEIPMCAVQVHPAMAMSDDMWRQDLQRLLYAGNPVHQSSPVIRYDPKSMLCGKMCKVVCSPQWPRHVTFFYKATQTIKLHIYKQDSVKLERKCYSA